MEKGLVDKNDNFLLLEIVNSVLKEKKQVHTPFTAALIYWRMLPRLLIEESQQISSTEGNSSIDIKQSWIRPEIFVSLFQSKDSFSQEVGKVFLLQVIPRLLLISSFKKSENNPLAFSQSLIHFSHMIAKKKVAITVSICPPYTYTLLKNGLLTSKNGTFRTNVGDGFNRTVSLLRNVFSCLLEVGISVNFRFVTYSGEKDHEDLVEITIPTRDFYKGKEKQMLTHLQLAYKDIQEKLKNVLEGSGITYETVSIETNHSRKVRTLAEKFLAKATVSKENAVKWLSSQLGVRPTWLNTFIESEEREAIIMGALQDEIGFNTSRIGRNGLQRGLLYYCILQSLHREGRFLIDLESQCYTMQDSIPQYTTFMPPVITGKVFNEPFGIRGPFEYENEE